jgi:hypothetical protein
MEHGVVKIWKSQGTGQSGPLAERSGDGLERCSEFTEKTYKIAGFLLSFSGNTL